MANQPNSRSSRSTNRKQPNRRPSRRPKQKQKRVHRSRSSIVLCAGLAGLAYELGLYVTGLFMGLTSWYRLPRFLLSGLYTAAAMFPLYYFLYRIGQIGGHTWKE